MIYRSLASAIGCVVEGSLESGMGKWRVPCIWSRNSGFVEVPTLLIMARGKTNKVGEISSLLTFLLSHQQLADVTGPYFPGAHQSLSHSLSINYPCKVLTR